MANALLKLIVLLMLLCSPCQSYAGSFKAVFLNPGFQSQNATGDFWFNVTMFMEAAARDLDIELVTIYAQRNHILMKTMVEDIVALKPKYVVLVNERGIALNIIKQLAKHNIATFMLLNNLNNEDFNSLTAKEVDLLKGSVVPNNYNAGKKLVKNLANLYQAQNSNIKPVKLLALQGDYSTPASIEREQGLMDTVKGSDNFIMIDSTVANWSSEQAYSKVKGIVQHARIDIIWAANDAMAFGAKRAVEELKLDYPIYIGGFNWDFSSHYSINLSYGGHVALGARSLIMLKDIDSNRLKPNERHKVQDIFESSLSSYYKGFTLRLRQKQLDPYDFSRFSLQSESPLAFTIENLSKTYSEYSGN